MQPVGCQTANTFLRRKLLSNFHNLIKMLGSMKTEIFELVHKLRCNLIHIPTRLPGIDIYVPCLHKYLTFSEKEIEWEFMFCWLNQVLILKFDPDYPAWSDSYFVENNLLMPNFFYFFFETESWRWGGQHYSQVRYHSGPIRGQYQGHVITLDQSKISIKVTWSLWTNLRQVRYQRGEGWKVETLEYRGEER